jgi:hypothetical protein
LIWCAVLLFAIAPLAAAQTAPAEPPGVRIDSGRFTIVADPRDTRLARSLMATAVARDTFPGLPRPSQRVLVAIAPDAARFRAWIGPNVPDWGAAVAFPQERRIVMQGGRAGSDAGDPRVVLRHELAHLALHEVMGELPPRWFDEGYASFAAGEWTREQALETSVGLVWRSMPAADSLEDAFHRGASDADWAYALAHRAVAELSALDTANGLANYFHYWKASGSQERALREAYGLTTEQFDRLWHSRTRRRYGALAIVSDISLVVGFFTLLLGPLFIARRRRDRRRLEVMRQHEATQDRAARESALAAVLDAGGQGP